MSMDSEIKNWKRRARQSGWRIVHRAAHERWYSPDGETIATISTTHLSPASIRNTRAVLRRGGLNV